MRYIYFWIAFSLCACSGVQGSSGIVPKRMNDVYYWELNTPSTHKSTNVAKHADRKNANHEEHSNRRLFGRHVCSQNKVTMVPVRDMQSYCKPAYQSYLRRCDKDSSRYCSGYRVVYELSYRTVQRMVAKTESVQSCCPGWTQSRISANDCKKAICREECQNGGTCTKPDHCSCPSGWTGKTCSSDIDECSRRKGHCDHECVNTVGSFRCLCKAGFTLREDGKTCEKINTTRKERELDAEIITKLEVMQKRLDALEEWQSQMLKREKDEARHQRDDQINSLSDQIAILEERLEECSCNKRDILNFSRIQK
ncbi:epidermal growth factor-like protein 8 [Caerostris darwini]|uniref:Epidermal growth factor-like protein 8 n=1 Tax=Caerostris darwini TaxID=1538125 RepID=A0AAV4U308_9ARAC|nr:epidermal growth factor-like protein 8 [Caerostris darwini]